jgi:hypothetical protein
MKGWSFHGDCDCCSQRSKLGLVLQDEEKDCIVFWCHACIDEHSDSIEILPPKDGAADEAEVEPPEPVEPPCLKRLASDEHPAFATPQAETNFKMFS